MSDLKGNNGVLLQDNSLPSGGAVLVLEMADWLLRDGEYLRADLPMRDQQVAFYQSSPLRVRLYNGDIPLFERLCIVTDFDICDHGIVRARLRAWGESRN
jgi:hypothetical protein